MMHRREFLKLGLASSTSLFGGGLGALIRPSVATSAVSAGVFPRTLVNSMLEGGIDPIVA